MQLALTGDVMLGRMVDQEVIGNQSLWPEAVWGDVLPILLAADLRVINLECVIRARGREAADSGCEHRQCPVPIL